MSGRGGWKRTSGSVAAVVMTAALLASCGGAGPPRAAGTSVSASLVAPTGAPASSWDGSVDDASNELPEGAVPAPEASAPPSGPVSPDLLRGDQLNAVAAVAWCAQGPLPDPARAGRLPAAPQTSGALIVCPVDAADPGELADSQVAAALAARVNSLTASACITDSLPTLVGGPDATVGFVAASGRTTTIRLSGRQYFNGAKQTVRWADGVEGRLVEACGPASVVEDIVASRG